MSDDETLKVYADKAEEYDDLTVDAASADPLCDAFLAAVPPHSHILDLGCGPGQHAAQFAAAGHQVTATDAVAEMAERAGRYEGVTARVATFDDIEGAQIYDGIWANFSLLHAPRKDMPRHLATLHKALKPGGIFHIALKSGSGSKRDTLGRLYTYYTERELTDLLHQAGFTVTDRAEGQEMGLDGVMADWIALRAHA